MKLPSLLQRIFILILTFALSAFGQTAPSEVVIAPTNQTTVADENFQLNITSDRIREINFERSTDVKLNDESRGRLRIEIGVGVRAERIDVLLRGIFGNVRFRASLESLKNRIEQLPGNSPVSPR